MNYFRKTKTPFFVLVLFLAFSCSKNEFEIESENVESEDFEVNVEMAISIAQDFSSSSAFAAYSEKEKPVNNSLKSGNIKPDKKVKNTSTINCNDGKPALYVIEYEPTGFVIVSASKKTETILAFSETGFFQYDPTIPIGVNDWVEDWKKRIKELRKNINIPDQNEIEDTSDGLPPPEDEEETIPGGTEIHNFVGPLLSTKWGQGIGYNDQAPLISGCTLQSNGRAKTGCVATAIAQVMKYWEHPNTYSWASMPDNYGTSATATLMRDIGDLVTDGINGTWGCSVTTGSALDAKNALIDDFGYSSSAEYWTYNSSYIEDQIDAGWPVVLRGADSNGGIGHVWVCDGYLYYMYITIHNPGTIYEYETHTHSPMYLGMNWGWDGDFNGWFLNYAWSVNNNDFNTGKSIILNIHE